MWKASIGIIMDAPGINNTLGTADVALIVDDLEKLNYALQLVHRNQRVINQNLG
jgi:Cd2+/Zn2+-exporting ATPase